MPDPRDKQDDVEEVVINEPDQVPAQKPTDEPQPEEGSDKPDASK